MERRKFLSLSGLSLGSIFLWCTNVSKAMLLGGTKLKKEPIMQATRNLTAIRFRCTLGEKEVIDNNGNVRKILGNIYPDFNALPEAIREGMDWSIYVDRRGLGMHYDLSPGGRLREGSDPEVQLCITAVPQSFAEAAVAQFPTEVQIVDETVFENFYNSRAHAHEPRNRHDGEVLQAIKNKRDLTGDPPDQDEQDALDPDNPQPGVRRNHDRTWALKKAKMNVSIDAPRALKKKLKR